MLLETLVVVMNERAVIAFGAISHFPELAGNNFMRTFEISRVLSEIAAFGLLERAVATIVVVDILSWSFRSSQMLIVLLHRLILLDYAGE